MRAPQIGSLYPAEKQMYCKKEIYQQVKQLQKFSTEDR